MPKRWLNALLILTSLFGYLEWGQGQSAFLFQAEAQMLRRGLVEPRTVVHPFTLLPLLGQLALAITIIQKSPRTALTYAGIAGIGVLLVFMCLIGLVSLNAKIVGSTIPFLGLAALTVRTHRADTVTTRW